MKNATFMDGHFLSVSHSLWLCHQVPLETSKEKARLHKVCTGKLLYLCSFIGCILGCCSLLSNCIFWMFPQCIVNV